MEALLIGLAVLLMFAAAVAAIGRLRPDLQLARVMARRGVVAGSDPATARKLARAARRCAACRQVERCERWLAAESESLDDFCPNARLLAELTPQGIECAGLTA
jgi:hypothetical protein